MITLDVAAASAALEAKVITDLRDEIAKAMASANGDINAQSEEFSKLFNARWPAENSDEFLQQFVKFSFGKAPSNVSQEKGKGKANDEAVASPAPANEHVTLQAVLHTADDTIKVEDADAIAPTPLIPSPSASSAIPAIDRRPTPGLHLPAKSTQQPSQPVFAISHLATHSRQIDTRNVPAYGRILKQHNAFPHCGGSGITKPIGEQKSVNYIVDMHPDMQLHYCFLQLKRVDYPKACILWPQPYDGVDTSNVDARMEFVHVEQFLDWLQDQYLPAHLNIHDEYLKFARDRAHLDSANIASNGAMMSARQNASAGPSRAMTNEKRSWDDRNEGFYLDRKKRSY
ncbi:uncharacterized protein EAF01_009696 [Botrytis porri]|uniref:Uncharacterized protein n=1 Tax=Botrytis porri TaxID=87229 RepID=A0A4Z1KXA0_9HELO|nr:uncharacterized protein EAF01_009696 [Botrytis porri]KAF7895734.1 hypothetical protein EAF01_009696 [Botrytis porri]TGO89121.1 hypothetical protein BPOR_0124g00100 [Botrytis porri]